MTGSGLSVAVTQPPSADVLLSETRWLQRLASRLVADPSLADDLVQDTLLTALTRRPLVNLRAFLATVLRHRLSRVQRRERKRDELARHLPPPAPPSTPDELVARAQLHRHVVDAVLALPEPYRAAVLLRHFEDVPLTAAAARLQVPVETLRTRCKRALQLLRERLDDRYGDRRGWAGLATGLALPLSATATPILLMSLKPVVATVAAVAAVAVLVLTLRDSEPVAATRIAADTGAPSAQSAELPAPLRDGTDRQEVGAAAVAAPSAPGVIALGIVVDEATKAPIEGARVGWARIEGALAEQTETVRTDAQGRFRLAGSAATNDDTYEVIVRAADHAITNAMLNRPERDGASPREYDLGVIEMPPGTGVAGTVVDAAGAPVADADLLLYFRVYWGEDGLRRAMLAQAVTVGRSGADGSFVLSDRLLPSNGAPLLLAVSERGLGWSELEDVTRARGETKVRLPLSPTATLRVHVDGPDGKPLPGAKVVAEPRFPPLGSDNDWPGHVAGVPALVRCLGAVTGSDGSATLAALPSPKSVPFQVRVTAPGCEPAAQRVVVSSGNRTEVAITLTAPLRYAVLGTVKDSAGRPIVGASVAAAYGSSATARSDDGGNYRIDGLARSDGPITVEVRAEGHTQGLARRAPKPGESELIFDFTLAPARRLVGRVLDQHGVAIAHANLWIEGGSHQSIDSDARGEFRFDDVPLGARVLSVQPPPAIFTAGVDLEIGAGQSSVTVVLQRPPAGNATLLAEVLDVDGRPLDPGTVSLESLARTDHLWHPAGGRIGLVTAGNLTPGRWQLTLSPARGHQLCSRFEVTDPDGEIHLRLQQTAGAVVRGRLRFEPPAIALENLWVTFLGDATARWQPLDGSQQLAGARNLAMHPGSNSEFLLTDVDPTRPLGLTICAEGFVGTAVVPAHAGERSTEIVVQQAATILFQPEPAFPHGQLRLWLRQPGADWGEPERFEGLRGRSQALPWTTAPGVFEWRIEGLPSSGELQPPSADGRVEVGPGGTATAIVRLRP